jgi:hypothetical protein
MPADNPDDETLPSTHPDEGREAWAERMIAHLERLLLNGDMSKAVFDAAMNDIIKGIRK